MFLISHQSSVSQEASPFLKGVPVPHPLQSPLNGNDRFSCWPPSLSLIAGPATMFLEEDEGSSFLCIGDLSQTRSLLISLFLEGWHSPILQTLLLV